MVVLFDERIEKVTIARHSGALFLKTQNIISLQKKVYVQL